MNDRIADKVNGVVCKAGGIVCRAAVAYIKFNQRHDVIYRSFLFIRSVFNDIKNEKIRKFIVIFSIGVCIFILFALLRAARDGIVTVPPEELIRERKNSLCLETWEERSEAEDRMKSGR